MSTEAELRAIVRDEYAELRREQHEENQKKKLEEELKRSQRRIEKLRQEFNEGIPNHNRKIRKHAAQWCLYLIVAIAATEVVARFFPLTWCSFAYNYRCESALHFALGLSKDFVIMVLVLFICVAVILLMDDACWVYANRKRVRKLELLLKEVGESVTSV